MHIAVEMPKTQMSAEEWQARVDLAAVYRLVAHHGWDDVIFNHCSMRVPGEDRNFLMKQHELLWTEVTASNLVKVDMDADLDETPGRQPPGLHAAWWRAARPAGRELRRACPHPHRHGDRRAQERAADDLAGVARFYGRIGYHPYEGITEDFGERERLITHLGNNRAMIMHNHGVLTVGKTARKLSA